MKTEHPLATDGDVSISKGTARERRSKAIDGAFRNKDPVLIDILPTIGKSYGVIKWAAETGNPLTVLAPRHELYDQYAEWCEDLGLRCKKLPSFHKDCPTASGEQGEKWAVKLDTFYQQKGLSAGEIHGQALKLFGELLPCQSEGECPYFSTRQFDAEEYDVLIGHYRHAHVLERIEGRYVVFDEFPEGEFESSFSSDEVSKAVGAFLDQHEGLTFKYAKDLKEFRRNPEHKQQGLDWFERYNPTLDRDPTIVGDDRSGNVHPDGAALTYALLVAEDLDNRWEYAQLPDGRTAVINPRDEGLTLLNPPSLSGAKSVIGLDGTPTLEKWRLLLGDNLQYRSIMTDTERGDYLTRTLKLEIIQTSEVANHYSGTSAISVTPALDFVLFEAVGIRENRRATLISSKAALNEYEAYDEVGLPEAIEVTENYGNLKGSNKFSDKRVGIVAGSPHYGFDYIKKWAAFAGESAEEGYDEDGVSLKGMAQDFGEFGNRILNSMRESSVLQAIMRFGRDGGGARIYVHTAALPNWVERSETATELRKWVDGMYEVLEAVRHLEQPEWRTRDLLDRVTISDTQVRNHLNSLDEFGYVSHRKEGRGFTWTDENLENIGRYGHMEFERVQRPA